MTYNKKVGWVAAACTALLCVHFLKIRFYALCSLLWRSCCTLARSPARSFSLFPLALACFCSFQQTLRMHTHCFLFHAYAHTYMHAHIHQTRTHIHTGITTLDFTAAAAANLLSCCFYSRLLFFFTFFLTDFCTANTHTHLHARFFLPSHKTANERNNRLDTHTQKYLYPRSDSYGLVMLPAAGRRIVTVVRGGVLIAHFHTP